MNPSIHLTQVSLYPCKTIPDCVPPGPWQPPVYFICQSDCTVFLSLAYFSQHNLLPLTFRQQESGSNRVGFLLKSTFLKCSCLLIQLQLTSQVKALAMTLLGSKPCSLNSTTVQRHDKMFCLFGDVPGSPAVLPPSSPGMRR